MQNNISIDKFFHKKYNKDTYNCAHFASEVWEEICEDSISKKLGEFLLPAEQRTANLNIRHCFKKLNKPESPCLVLMQRRRCNAHVGVYIRGKVLHIQEHGVEFLPIDIVSIGFDKIGFYK